MASMKKRAYTTSRCRRFNAAIRARRILEVPGVRVLSAALIMQEPKLLQAVAPSLEPQKYLRFRTCTRPEWDERTFELETVGLEGERDRERERALECYHICISFIYKYSS